MLTLLAPLVLVLNDLDPSPEPADVKAGWGAFGIFIALLVVIALLGWSLSRHLRRVEDNRKAGVFGDRPEPAGRDDDASTGPANGSTPLR